ncbi:MAG: endonuclease V [Candidatus Schekmanbacteria bacterium]|nr:endonuclease V [Candidatus Schekmanbacteria bacterium]
MKIRELHAWPRMSTSEAKQLQLRLRELLVWDGGPASCALVAGGDGTYRVGQPTGRASAVIWSTEELTVVERSFAERELTMPYIPGLFSFREAPVLLEAFRGLRHTPDVVLLDGHGLAHPRRFGLACHVGLFLDLPTIGCAKSLLVGKHGDLASDEGATAPIVHEGEVVGAAVRTRRGCRPVYVSQGYRISLARAIEIVLLCARGRRLPEPARLAHLALQGERTWSRPPAC